MAAEESKAAILARLARDINCITDADRHKRRRALQTVFTSLLDGPEAPPLPVARDIVCHDLQRPLLAAVSDSSEMNREASIEIFATLLRRDTSYAAHENLYPMILSTLCHRVGKIPFVEDAEEIRLKLTVLLNGLLSCPSTRLFTATHTPEIADIIKSLASDAFPAVKIASSESLVLLCSAATDTVHGHLHQLATSQTLNLHHQRGPVRVAALNALQSLIPLGAESLDKVLTDTVLPALRNMRHDRTASLRKQLATTCCHLISHLPRHCLSVSIEGALLYLVCGLVADESPDVGAHALACLEADAIVSRPSEIVSPDVEMMADIKVAADAASGNEGTSALMNEVANTCGTGYFQDLALHFEPFASSPPSAALISLVQARLAGIVACIFEDLRDWTAKNRAFAAAALRSLFPLAQEKLTTSLNPIIAALCTGSRDEETDVRRLLGDCSRLLGMFIPAEAQLGVLLPQLQGSVSGLNNGDHYAAALAVAAAAVSTMSTGTLAAHVEDLAGALSLPHLAEDEPTQLRRQLGLVVRSLITAGIADGCSVSTITSPCSPDALEQAELSAARLAVTASEGSVISSKVVQDLLVCLLRLYDPMATEDVLEIASECSMLLASKLGFNDINQLMSRYALSILEPLSADVKVWTKLSHSRRAFDALLRHFRGALVATDADAGRIVLHICAQIFAATLNPSRDSDLRVVMLALLDALIIARREDPSVVVPPPEVLLHMDVQPPAALPGERVQEFREPVDALLSEVSDQIVLYSLLPNLVWRMGMVASTIRKVAISCLLSLLRRNLLPLAQLQLVWVELQPVVTGNLSDDDATTRDLATNCFTLMFSVLGPHLPEDDVFKLYSEILKRLDDSNDSVRVSACGALHNMAVFADPAYLRSTATRFTIDTMLVHLDDLEVRVQKAVFGALEAWMPLEPDYARKQLAQARVKHRNPALCNLLISRLPVDVK